MGLAGSAHILPIIYVPESLGIQNFRSSFQWSGLPNQGPTLYGLYIRTILFTSYFEAVVPGSLDTFPLNSAVSHASYSCVIFMLLHIYYCKCSSHLFFIVFCVHLSFCCGLGSIILSWLLSWLHCICIKKSLYLASAI